MVRSALIARGVILSLAAVSLAAGLNGRWEGGAAVQNRGFERSPFLAGWTTKVQPEPGSNRLPTFAADGSQFKEGRQSLLIEALDPADAVVSQRIFLPVGSLWRASAWIKTEKLRGTDPSHAGGYISIRTPVGDIGRTAALSGSTPWQEGQASFRVPSPGFVDLTLVGTHKATGRAWFDDVRLEAVPPGGREDVGIFPERVSLRPINVMQQGQFIEILCNLIPSIIAQQVVSTSFEEAPPCRVSFKKAVDEPYRPWYPDGAVQVARYSLDSANPFNGSHSERIAIPALRARAGISQDGFYLKQGVDYRLRLHMRGEGNVEVQAALHGDGHLIAGPVSLGRAGESWAAAQAVLHAGSSAQNATLTIDFEGPGTLWLDRVYLIGSDAVLGLWRPDVVAALRSVHPGIIRFGGSTTEEYEWDRGIGAWDQRQPFTTVWGGLEENFVGIDEFIQLCQYIGAEPLICVRWTGKKPEDAAAEVEYCNGGPETKWGRRRARNGHPQPYRVKYWQIGNEVDVAQYNSSVRSFAEAMKRADPTIKLISSFPTKSLLQSAGTAFDYLAPHHYEVGDLPDEDRNFKDLQDWIERQGGGRDIRVAVTEWNTTAGEWGLTRGMLQTLGNALSVSRYLNLLQRHSDLVEIANRSNFADSCGSGFLITGPGWIYESPAYYAQKLYSRAAGAFPLRLERSSKLAWQLQEPDLSASLSSDGSTLRIYAVNSTTEAVSCRFDLDALGTPARAARVYTLADRQRQMTAEAMNSRDDPERVSVTSDKVVIPGSRFEFTFDPLTVTLLEVAFNSSRR